MPLPVSHVKLGVTEGQIADVFEKVTMPVGPVEYTNDTVHVWEYILMKQNNPKMIDSLIVFIFTIFIF
jgi:hypothetical protein